ncbi:hypothetical protein ACFO9Q_11645 [Paenibacillus sp. GCM10023252]|uniref:hypothetical protein n=1 Tax=Paenibacillus sp. GCM10023252 TaxID=3252649 RepID=UPI003624357C
MLRKWSPLMIGMVVLIGIGIVSAVINNPSTFIIPVVVLGVIFLLYKLNPGGARSRRPVVKPSPRTEAKMKAKSQQARKKPAPFRVIEGGKDDDDLPKYH